MKHSKYRNTAFLFEVLLKKAAFEVLEGKKNPKAINIIKKRFAPSTELNHDISFYNIIMKDKLENSDQIHEYLTEVKKKRNKNVVGENLKKEQHELVKDINTTFNDKSVYNIEIPSYTILASIKQMFDSEEDISQLKEAIKLKSVIVTHMLLEESEKPMKIDKLTQAMMKMNYDDRYNSLSEAQRSVLTDILYGKDYNVVFEKNIAEIKKTLSDTEIKNQATKIKVDEVLNKINEVSNNDENKQNNIEFLLYCYELCEKLNTNKELLGND